MNKKLIISLALITGLVLIILGFVFQKTDNEKVDGLSEIFGVSPDDKLAVTHIESGKSRIHFSGEDTSLLETDSDVDLIQLYFTEDKKYLYYVTNAKDKKSSQVNKLELKSGESQLVFESEFLVSEISFNQDESVLYYLQANTYENYSPIAGKAPHDYDIYKFDLETEKQDKITQLEAYGMASLHVAADESFAYINLPSQEAETADEIFEDTSKIYKISLDKKDEITAVTPLKDMPDIAEFTKVPGEERFIYPATETTDATGTFIYELFQFDAEKNEHIQLTELKDAVSYPKVSPDGKSVYFMFIDGFGSDEQKLSLQKLDLETKEVKLITE